MHQNLSEDEVEVDRVKDDMASRRISSHIPAPLRKKKNDDQYKRFITPSGNPQAYLQQHMRSKSMSDLNEEKKEEENHRAEINMRYEEMEKLKVMLKEEEDTWTSKLQNWKNRRRSVTEDARRRKEERDSLEKEAENKSIKRKTKTYKQIVEEKMRRDKELALFDDHDEYEFVSPRSSTSGNTLGSPRAIESTSYIPDVKILENDRPERNTMIPNESDDVFSSCLHKKVPADRDVEYKYTTRVTAVVNNPLEVEKKGRSSLSIDLTTTKDKSKEIPTYRSTITTSLEMPNKNATYSRPQRSTIATGAPSEEARSNVPKVLLRSKNPDARKERPKSAHDLPRVSSTLPRNYRDYSTPRPYAAAAGGTNFMRYRKTAFANRRNMWENMSVPDNHHAPVLGDEIHHSKHSSDELLSKQTTDVAMTNYNSSTSKHKGQFDTVEIPAGSTVAQSLNKYEKLDLDARNPVKTGAPPPKVPLVSEPYSSQSNQHVTDSRYNQTTSDAAFTATLSPGGLSMTSPRITKAYCDVPNAVQTEALFDDMKICINQRPRSEKGFGFTVRGGDDGKPVIVDTVSPGGAADICQLCVSDEILAINEVLLADCKTQDDIVQLIVSSVITGNLSLNIRRYGKPKKVSPLRLSGTKVVMTPGGFVQVRSDRPISQTNLSNSGVANHKEVTLLRKDGNNNDELCNDDDDLPPPPTQQELAAAAVGPNHLEMNERGSPLLDLITAASRDSKSESSSYGTPRSIPKDDSESLSVTALSEVYSNKNQDFLDDDDELSQEVSEAQRALELEQLYQHEKQLERDQLRLKLKEEQKRLEQEEAQREEIKKRIQEEARLEDLKVEEELRKIKARQLKQQQERKKDTNKSVEQPTHTAGAQVRQQGMRSGVLGQRYGRHWMIEEAERRRVAETQGKPRSSAMDRSLNSNPMTSSALPQHVIQHLTQRTSKSMGPRPYVREPPAFGGDRNANATLI